MEYHFVKALGSKNTVFEGLAAPDTEEATTFEEEPPVEVADAEATGAQADEAVDKDPGNWQPGDQQAEDGWAGDRRGQAS